MRHLTLILIAITFTGQLLAQKYLTRNGHISFFSSTPIEDIEAHNYQASSIIDTETGDIAFTLLIKGFQFEKALMQEHFNEKYMESDKFPKATFKGTITNIEEVNLNEPGTYTVTVSGELTIHGVTKEVTSQATITHKEGKLIAKATFPVTVADYNITIPSVVRDNIAKVVEVSVDATYDPYKSDK